MTTLLSQQILMNWCAVCQDSLVVRASVSNNSAWIQSRKLITPIWWSIWESTYSMRQIRPMFADKSLPTRKEKKSKYFGQRELTMKWRKWLMVTHPFGRCMKTLGIQFQVSCLFVFIQTTISECPTLGSNTSRILDCTTWWLRIRCIFLRAIDRTLQKRIPTAPKNCGGHRRT